MWLCKRGVIIYIEGGGGTIERENYVQILTGTNVSWSIQCVMCIIFRLEEALCGQTTSTLVGAVSLMFPQLLVLPLEAINQSGESSNTCGHF